MAAHKIRVLGESKHTSAAVPDSFTGEPLFWWRGNDLRVEVALADNGAFLLSGDVGSITVLVKGLEDGPDDSPSMIKTLGAGDCDIEFTSSTWDSGSKSLCVAEWTKEEAALAAGEYRLIITHDDPSGNRNTYLSSEVTVKEDNHDSTSLDPPDPPASEYYTQPESNARFATKATEQNLADHEADSNPHNITANLIGAVSNEDLDVLEGEIDTLTAQILAISNGAAPPDYRSATLAAAPATANSSGDAEFLIVYAEVSPNEDNNGLYYREDAATTWVKVPGDLTGRVVNLEAKTIDLKAGLDSSTIMPIHGEVDSFGNTIVKTGFRAGGDDDGQIFPPQKTESSKLGGKGVFLRSRDKTKTVQLLTPGDIKQDYPSFVRDGEGHIARKRQAEEAAMNALLSPRAEAAATTYSSTTWGTESTTFRGVSVTARTHGATFLKATATLTEQRSAFVGILATDGVDVTLTHSITEHAAHWSTITTDTRAVKGGLVGGLREWLIPLKDQPPVNDEVTYYFKGNSASIRVCGIFFAEPLTNPNPADMTGLVLAGSLQNYGQGCLSLSNDDLLVATQNPITGMNEVTHFDYDTGTATVTDLESLTSIAIDQHNGGSLAILGDGKILHVSTGHNEHAKLQIAKSTEAIPVDSGDWGAVSELTLTGVTNLTYTQIFPTAGGKVYLITRGSYSGSGGDSFLICWSDDHGATWNAGDWEPLVDYYEGAGAREYTLGHIDGGKIYFVTMNGSFSTEPNNLWCFYLDTATDNYYQMDGTLIQALSAGSVKFGDFDPFTEYSIGEYASGKDLRDHHQSSRLFPQQMVVDSDGVLHVYYVAYQRDDDHDRPATGDYGEDVRQLLYRASYIDGKWVREFVANQGSPYFQSDNGGLFRIGFAVDPVDPDKVIFSGDAAPNDWTRRGITNEDYHLYRATRANGVWRYELIGGPYTEDYLANYFDRSRGPGKSRCVFQLGKMVSYSDTPISINSINF